MFREKLPELFNEIKSSLIEDGEKSFADQLSTLKIKSCSPFSSDNSAFTINFTTSENEEIDDSFPTGDSEYTIMVAYSTNGKVIGLDVIGCENTDLQKKLMQCCI